MTVDNVVISEGDSVARFTCRVSGSTGEIRYQTFDISATAGEDYDERSWRLPFSTTDPIQEVDVPVRIDSQAEGTETFGIRFTSTNRVTIVAPWSQVEVIRFPERAKGVFAAGAGSLFYWDDVSEQTYLRNIAPHVLLESEEFGASNQLLAADVGSVVMRRKLSGDGDIDGVILYNSTGSRWEERARYDLADGEEVVAAAVAHSEKTALAVRRQGGEMEVRAFRGIGQTQPPQVIPVSGRLHELAVSRLQLAYGQPENGDERGEVTAFAFDDVTWNEWRNETKISPDELEPGDRFGTSVFVSENLVLVGAPGDDDGGENAGAVYVFAGPDFRESKATLLTKIVLPAQVDGEVAPWPPVKDASMPMAAAGRRVLVGVPSSPGGGRVHLIDTVFSNLSYAGAVDPPEGFTRFGQQLSAWRDLMVAGAVAADGVESGILFRSNVATATIRDLGTDPIKVHTYGGKALEGEANAMAVFDISLSRPSFESVTLGYRTVSGTAEAGVDFVAMNGEIVFDPGESFAKLKTPLIGDRLDEVDESFALEFFELPDDVELGDVEPFVIVDDDPKVRVQPVALIEGDSAISRGEISFTANAAPGRPIPLRLSLGEQSPFFRATEGVDFFFKGTDVMITPESPQVEVSLPVIGDPYREGDETFFIRVDGGDSQIRGAWRTVEEFDLGIPNGFPPYGWAVDDTMAAFSYVGGYGESRHFVFEESDSGWSAVAEIRPPIRQGHLIALDGSTLVATRPGVRINNRPGPWQLIVYERHAQGKDTWSEFERLQTSLAGLSTNDGLALDGDTLIVSGVRSGRNLASVFRRIGGKHWEDAGFLTANLAGEDDAPISCAIDGLSAAVSARNGGVAFFQRNSQGAWRQNSVVLPAEQDSGFGSGVELSLPWACVGGWSNKLWLYRLDGNQWSNAQSIDLEASLRSFELSGENLVALTSRGTFTYFLQDGEWVLRQHSSLQISAMGETLAIGGVPPQISRPTFADVTIVEDDAEPISTGNFSAPEGDDGMSTVSVSLPAQFGPPVVTWETVDGSATAGEDYVAAAGTTELGLGRTLSIEIMGDKQTEGDEIFWIVLSDSSLGAFPRNYIGIVIEDDDLGVALINEETPVKYLIPTVTSNTTGWREIGFDDSGWAVGLAGIGYDRGEPARFSDFLGQDSSAELYGRETSIFARYRFSSLPPGIRKIFLEVRYDDGFVAFINGAEVARANVSEGSAERFDVAVDDRSDFAAATPVVFEIDTSNFELRPENVLAIHGLNDSPVSERMLLAATLKTAIREGGNFGAWAAFHGGVPGVEEEDSDGDGWDNLLEYAFGTNPTLSGSVPSHVGEMSFPLPGITELRMASKLPPRKDLTIELQASATLNPDGGWWRVATWTFSPSGTWRRNSTQVIDPGLDDADGITFRMFELDRPRFRFYRFNVIRN